MVTRLLLYQPGWLGFLVQPEWLRCVVQPEWLWCPEGVRLFNPPEQFVTAAILEILLELTEVSIYFY